MTDREALIALAACKCRNPSPDFAHKEADEWNVVCRLCGHEGLTCFTKRGAIIAWNTRAQTSSGGIMT